MINRNELPWSGVLCTRRSAYPKWVVLIFDGGLPMLQRRITMENEEFNRRAFHPRRDDIRIVPVAQQHNPIADCLSNEIWIVSSTLYHKVITMLIDPANLCRNQGYRDFLPAIVLDYMEKCPITPRDKPRVVKYVYRWYGTNWRNLDGLDFADFVYEVVAKVLEGLKN